jgi:hypothetical protein
MTTEEAFQCASCGMIPELVAIADSFWKCELFFRYGNSSGSDLDHQVRSKCTGFRLIATPIADDTATAVTVVEGIVRVAMDPPQSNIAPIPSQVLFEVVTPRSTV